MLLLLATAREDGLCGDITGRKQIRTAAVAFHCLRRRVPCRQKLPPVVVLTRRKWHDFIPPLTIPVMGRWIREQEGD